ncbi:hypothetical protein [Spiroplasma endosymbiont of Zeiraphera isertana]|uniref:hypothetical protein n=1 Tax=Spiroplasma endosymbiont of Zeiraphera isertana TaxID=3066313 RepID=UPI00313D287D
MPWKSIENNKLKQEAHAKNADKINKAWGEKNESERRERVCQNLELDKSKINSESSSSESKNSSSKNSNQL